MTDSVNDADNDRKLKAGAPFILFTVFLDMLSIGIMVPVLPLLIKSFVGNDSEAALWVGIAGALWGVAQFIFSPIQGGMSDRYGRRPVVLASNLGSAIDYGFMAIAPNLWLFMVGRFISGATAASISTAYAYMSDVTPPEKRAGVFGMMGAAFGLGFIIGPGLGGLMAQFGTRAPFMLAAGLSFVNFLYGYFVLPESLSKDRRKALSFKTTNPFGAIQFLARSAQVFRLAVVYLVMMFAHSVYPTTFVIFAIHKFHWGSWDAAKMLMLVGVLSSVVQGGLTGPIVKMIGERKAMWIGLTCGAIGFFGYGFAPTPLIMMACAPIAALSGLVMPSIQALMTAKVDPKEQGTLQGSNTSMSTLATIFAPLIFGTVLSAVTKDGMPLWWSGAAFGLAGLFVLLALFLSLGVKPALKIDHAAYPDPETPPAH